MTDATHPATVIPNAAERSEESKISLGRRVV